MNIKTIAIFAGGLALTALPSAIAADPSSQLKRIDANGDGRISRSEYIAEAQVRFNKLDANEDGVVAAAELYSIPDPMKTGKMKPGVRAETDGPAGTPAGKLGQADKNSDGRISRSENEADAEAHFAAMDTDKDGVLTDKELDAGVKAMSPDR